MTYVSSEKNYFRWPVKDDILNYELKDIVVIGLTFKIYHHHFGINKSQFPGLQQTFFFFQHFKHLKMFFKRFAGFNCIVMVKMSMLNLFQRFYPGYL